MKKKSANILIIVLSIVLICLVAQFFVPKEAFSENDSRINDIENQGLTFENVVQENGTVAIAEEILTLKVKIHRTFQYLERLDQIVEKTRITTVNTSRLENMVHRVRSHLEKAVVNLEEHDIRGAITEYINANSLVQQLLTVYSNLSMDIKALKTTNFLIEAEKRFSQIKPNITLSAENLPEPEKNATLRSLKEAENSLKRAKDSLEDNRIADTVDELISFHKEINTSLNYIKPSQIELGKED